MSRYLKTADSEWYKQRIIGAIICALAVFAVLLIRLFFLQVLKGEEYSRLSENNSIRLQTIDAPRGMIFDRSGKLMVDNRPSFDVSIIPKDARPLGPTLDKLSKLLSVPKEELNSKVAGQTGILTYQPITLKQDIGRRSLAFVEVNKYDLPGIMVNVELRRLYIHKQAATHLLGYLGEINSAELKSGKYTNTRSGDLIGKYGAEKVFDNFLRGKRGGRQVEVNANGQVVKILKTVNARPGNNIYLTIDLEVQNKAEELLKDVLGAIVAIEPASGQILALASSPSFDQNAFVRGMSHGQWEAFIANPLKPLTNRAVQGEYPPASTYKILTAIAGLEEGVIDENTTFTCPGFYKFNNREYRCWKKGGHGTLSVVQAIAESCDVFFYQVGQGVGIDRLAWYARACGLGSRTGINLDNETQGLIPTAAWKKRRTGIEWQEGETLSVAIGQGFNLVTPLQMTGLISGLANDGIKYKPEILGRIETADGQVIKKTEPQVMGQMPISPKTMALVKEGLWRVVNSDRGTAKGARFPGIDISGKTGTAQVVSRKEDEDEPDEEDIPDHLKPHAWFVAYAPSADPKIAVAVVVEHGEHGSGAAAPIAREVIKAYLLKDQLGKRLLANGKEAAP
ncbi:MAG: penicillin-binding protein 2 [Deltaproteobacteria bacterium]|nr:MAG: penicillin-binding protein 2 [Deltaproteobacteria bacterium]